MNNMFLEMLISLFGSEDFCDTSFIIVCEKKSDRKILWDFFEENIPESELEYMGYTKSSILSHIDFNGTISYFFDKRPVRVKINYVLVEADCLSDHVNKYNAEGFISYVKENAPYLFYDNNIDESDENVEFFL